MTTRGKFVYKGIEKRDGGEFKNDKGNLIKYQPAYNVSLDELVEGKVVNRNFRFGTDNEELYNKFHNFDIYDEIIVAFEITLYKANVKLVPVDVYITEEE